MLTITMDDHYIGNCRLAKDLGPLESTRIEPLRNDGQVGMKALQSLIALAAFLREPVPDSQSTRRLIGRVGSEQDPLPLQGRDPL